MYKHILIATDGSELAQKGVDHGLSLAKNLDGEVVIVTVTEPMPVAIGRAASAGMILETSDIDRYEEAQNQFADSILGAAKAAAEQIGVPVQAVRITASHPAEAIIDAAQKHHCSLIVMASHGRRGLGRLLLGSQTAEVVAKSNVPVLVVR